ncbi:MAG: hypothetical protein R3257_00400 [bacterium]|nr:hypothetical protein [bacterium]
MEPKRYQLFIDGKHYFRRGLDLAYNPFNGNVLGEVVLVSETLLNKDLEEDEETVRLFREDALDS